MQSDKASEVFVAGLINPKFSLPLKLSHSQTDRIPSACSLLGPWLVYNALVNGRCRGAGARD